MGMNGTITKKRCKGCGTVSEFCSSGTDKFEAECSKCSSVFAVKVRRVTRQDHVSLFRPGRFYSR
jgi:hypothetical protein